MGPRTLVPAAGVAAVLALAGCGGTKAENTDPIGTAVEKTIEQGSERTSVNGTVTLQGRPLQLTGQGGFDHVKQEGYQELEVTVPGSGSSRVDEVFVKSAFWLKSPLFTGSLPKGRQWVKVDLRRAGRSLGFNFKALLGQTPDDALEQLRRTGTGVSEVGEEEIDGVQTTHYRAPVDPRKVPANDKMQRLTAASYKPVDVWIDGDDLVRRIRLDFTARADPAQPVRAHAVITMTLSDFGAPIDVEPPAASLVVDATAPVGSG
jgi:hypothetical protein